jgi:tetratricopeptide (TPR) repeat protein
MTKLRSVCVFLVLLAVSLSAASARADDATEVERAKASYDAGRYADGVERFREILSPSSPNVIHEPLAVERARAYLAACLIAVGRDNEADAEIEKVIRNNPVYSPDAVAFPGKVVDRFIEIKSRLKGEIEAAFRARTAAEQAAKVKVERQQREYLESLQRQASQETVVVRHSRLIAMIPFGVGQFQNGQDGLGYVFLVAESALAVTTIVSSVVYSQLIADYIGESPAKVDYAKSNAQLDAAYNVNIYSTVSLAAVAVAGIVHAQATFVPETQEVRTRPLPPPPPQFVPRVGVGPAGFSLTLGGRF